MSTVDKVDFFSSATRMSIAQISRFFRDVVFTMNPSKCAPIIIWGPPGCGKSQMMFQIFKDHKRGLLPLVASQLSVLDSNGLPQIKEIDVVDGEETHSLEVTQFTPTMTFGRGFKNIFLDELNNASPTMMAGLQNLLSARELGGDKFIGYIIAACNPPSTNSLANDLNHPIMSRCLHLVVDYTLDDFTAFAMDHNTIHPAILAFHKKTSGIYLEAKWDMLKNKGYAVNEPVANEPYPSPRGWELASEFLFALTASGQVDYTFIKPIVEGLVGIVAAREFATTYAYMNRLPDIEGIYSGKVVGGAISQEIVVAYLTAFTFTSYISVQVEKAKADKIQCRLPKDSGDSKTPAWHLIAGIHRSLQFVSKNCSVELCQVITGAVTKKVRDTLNDSFLHALYSDIDPSHGLTRANTFVRSTTEASQNRASTANAF